MDEAALVEFARRRLEPVFGKQPAGWFFLAGGAFKSILHGRPPRDLDLWPATRRDYALLQAQLVRRGAVLEKDNPPYQTSFSLDGGIIELAHDVSARTLEDRLERFDLAPCAIGVEHRAGQWRSAIHPRAAESIRRGEVLLLTPLVNWKYALATLERLHRYSRELGFAVPLGEEEAIWRVFERQSPEEQKKMIARYLRVCTGNPEILEQARSRSGVG